MSATKVIPFNKHASKRPGEPSEAEIQQTVDFLVHSEYIQFSTQLETAREMWRHYRDMVEAPEYPEPFLSAELRDGHDPREFEVDPDCYDLALDPAIREILKPQAIEFAKQRARNIAAGFKGA
jgi:hypothetical protein